MFVARVNRPSGRNACLVIFTISLLILLYGYFLTAYLGSHQDTTSDRTAMNQTKITVKLHTNLLKAFDTQIDQLFLKRDAFLNHLIRTEVPSLAEEMEDRRLSPEARRHVAGHLKRMGTTTVNVVVDKDVADALNAVVERSNMVRDAFMNRVLLFMRSSEWLLGYLDLPQLVRDSEFNCVPDQIPTSPIRAIKSVLDDPFYYLRIGAYERHQSGLYLLPLPPKFVGFSCFLDDAFVPGTEGHAAMEKEVEQMLKEIDALESEAFATPLAGVMPDGGTQ